MKPENYNPRSTPPSQRTAEGHLAPRELNRPEQAEYSKVSIKRKLAASVLAVLSVAGIAHVALGSGKDIDPVESAEIQRPNSDESKQLELESLPLESRATFAEGVFKVDPSKLNIRKSPHVRDGEGENNQWKISSGSFVVVNPASASIENTSYNDFANTNISWFVAVDSDGNQYYFSGNNGGITNLETGAVVKNLGANLSDGKIIATTTEGSVVKNDIGENELIATITQG